MPRSSTNKKSFQYLDFENSGKLPKSKFINPQEVFLETSSIKYIIVHELHTVLLLRILKIQKIGLFVVVT